MRQAVLDAIKATKSEPESKQMSTQIRTVEPEEDVRPRLELVKTLGPQFEQILLTMVVNMNYEMVRDPSSPEAKRLMASCKSELSGAPRGDFGPYSTCKSPDFERCAGPNCNQIQLFHITQSFG